VSNGDNIALKNVRVSGFAVGLYDRHAYSVSVDRSTLYGNAFNIMIHWDANHWSVRDSTVGLALPARTDARRAASGKQGAASGERRAAKITRAPVRLWRARPGVVAE
jgi:hypothetical protein